MSPIKKTRTAELKGCGSGGSLNGGFLNAVTVELVTTDDKDFGRPVRAFMSPERAREVAALLNTMADMVDERLSKKAPEKP